MKVSLKKTHQLSGKLIDVIENKPLEEVFGSLQLLHSYLLNIVTPENNEQFVEHFEALERIGFAFKQEEISLPEETTVTFTSDPEETTEEGYFTPRAKELQ